jgi:hypothetical protein
MSKQHLKYLKNEVIEDVTASRIRQYEEKAGVTVRLRPALRSARTISARISSCCPPVGR